MKNLILLSAFLFLFAACVSDKKKTEGVADIKDVRSSGEPNVDSITHQANDVEVYRTFFIAGEAYKVFYYRMENDSLKSHMAIYGSNESYDKVAYNWLNDTLVSIRLFNSQTAWEKKFKVFGMGNSSGMDMDN